MNNQRGEIVTGIMVVMMATMMIFGMVFMHGGHGDGHDHENAEHKQEHADKGHQHMHEGNNATEQTPVSDTEKTK
jgi:ABC-type nickel/cobalt efflux system permease component RcnA